MISLEGGKYNSSLTFPAPCALHQLAQWQWQRINNLWIPRLLHTATKTFRDLPADLQKAYDLVAIHLG
jgi:hypothetical protein